MKVKISYTVDLDSVPDLIKDLLNKNKKNLLLAVELTEEVVNNDLSVDSYKKIVDACNEIEATRSVYEDCYSLLGSYIKTVADISIPDREEKPAPQEQTILDNINKINTLTEKLNNRQKEQDSEHD